MPTRLLEREAPLAALLTALDEAEGGRGSIALVSGEAGIGKTSLVREFATRAEARARLLRAACDDLVTPRTLGPLHDAAAGTDGPLATALAEEGPVFTALLEELEASAPTVLIVEDAQWADDATLDVLGYVGPAGGGQAGAARPDRARRGGRPAPPAAPALRDAGAGPGAPARARTALARRGQRARRGHRSRRRGRPRPDARQSVLRRRGAGRAAGRGAGQRQGRGAGARAAALAGVPRCSGLHLGGAVDDPDRPGAGGGRARRRWRRRSWRGWSSCGPRGSGSGTSSPGARSSSRCSALRRRQLNAAVVAALRARGGADRGRLLHHAAQAGDVETLLAEGPAAARGGRAGGLAPAGAGALPGGRAARGPAGSWRSARRS